MSSVDNRWAMTNVVRPSISWVTPSAMRRSVSRIDPGRRLVENDEVGVAQPHPGEREQLRLAG